LLNTNFVFGFINISDIPYKKLEELFKDQFTDEEFLFDETAGYSINQELYNKHKEFFDTKIPFTFDFNLFQYDVGFSGDTMDTYTKDYYDEMPPYFE